MMMFTYKDNMLDVKDENKILSGQGYDGYIGALLKAYGNRDLKWQKTEKRISVSILPYWTIG